MRSIVPETSMTVDLVVVPNNRVFLHTSGSGDIFAIGVLYVTLFIDALALAFREA